MGRREEGKNDRRARITAAARALIQTGNSGFRMRALAEAAGVSIATPYNLFGSKQEILAAVMEEDLGRVQARLASKESDSLALISQTVNVARELMEVDPDFYRNLVRAYPNLEEAEQPRLNHWKQLVEAAISDGFLMTSVDPFALATLLRQLFVASFIRWAKDEISAREAEAQISFGIAICLAGVATPASRNRLQSNLRDLQETLRSIRMKKVAVRQTQHQQAQYQAQQAHQQTATN